MKVVVMGTPDFAVPALEALAASEHEVTLVVCQPDRPKGRSAKLVECPVKECAEKHGIPVFQPERVKRAEAVEVLRKEAPDLIIAAAYGQILSQEILDIPKYGCLNIHGSLLPAYRGAAPIQWAVINGETKSGNTIMKMNAGLDTGDILLQEETAITDDDTAESLYERLSVMGGPLLLKAMKKLEEGTLQPIPQDESKATFAPMLKKEDGLIDWKTSAREIDCKVRGMNPWPCVYTVFRGKTMKVWGAKAEDASSLAPAGTVTNVTKNEIRVAAGKGTLVLTQVQLEGKKRMSVHDFLLGNPVSEGEVFG